MARIYALAPNGSDARLSVSIVGYSGSLSSNGWTKLPNGLILQWIDAESFTHAISDVFQNTVSSGWVYTYTWVYPISSTMLSSSVLHHGGPDSHCFTSCDTGHSTVSVRMKLWSATYNNTDTISGEILALFY